jgi:hypothetical protein
MSETPFTEARYDLISLINYIEIGETGLPDLQRPFVWKNIKVRNLFDSMYGARCKEGLADKGMAVGNGNGGLPGLRGDFQ